MLSILFRLFTAPLADLTTLNTLISNTTHHFQYFEYLRVYDYANGYMALCDFRNINLLDFASKVNPVELRQIITTIVVSIILSRFDKKKVLSVLCCPTLQ